MITAMALFITSGLVLFLLADELCTPISTINPAFHQLSVGGDLAMRVLAPNDSSMG